MGRRRYTDADRAAGLAALAANGGELYRTSQQINVPYSTLERWVKGADEATSQLRAEKRSDLAERLEQIAHDLVSAMPGKLEGANLQQVATSLGIAVDKMRLLKGEATTINEVRDDGAAKLELAERLKRLAAFSGAN